MPPEFFGQNICGACEGEGTNLVGATCRFCGGTGERTAPPQYDPPSPPPGGFRPLPPEPPLTPALNQERS